MPRQTPAILRLSGRCYGQTLALLVGEIVSRRRLRRRVTAADVQSLSLPRVGFL